MRTRIRLMGSMREGNGPVEGLGAFGALDELNDRADFAVLVSVHGIDEVAVGEGPEGR